jgi:hypothetical protein
MSVSTSVPVATPAADAPGGLGSLERISARFGVAFTICQLGVMVAMAMLVLPQGGNIDDPPLVRGRHVLEAVTAYRVGNYGFMLAGSLLLGFLGVVAVRLRRVDSSGILATTATVAGTLLALVWPLGGLLHDVALEAADAGTDLRLLGAWDAVAPLSLAFSVLPRVFFVGAIVIGLRRSGTAPWLSRLGLLILPLSLVGSATLVIGDLFPLLALSTLAYELWVGAVAWHWLRHD